MMKGVFLNRLLIGIAVALVLCSGLARADLVVKKNGESIKGRVLHADSNEVQIEAGGIVLHLPRNEIVDIQYDQGDVKVTDEVVAIRALEARGQLFGPGGAVEKLKGLLSHPDVTKQEFVTDEARKVGDAAFKQLQSFTNPPQGISPDIDSTIKGVSELSDAALQPLWQAAYPGDDYNRVFRANIDKFEGRAYLLRGKAAIEGSQQNLDAARQDLAKAAVDLGPQGFLNDAYVDLASFRWAEYWQLAVLKQQFENLPKTQQNTVLNATEQDIEDLFKKARNTNPGAGLPEVPMDSQLFDLLHFLEGWFRDQRLAFISVTPTSATPRPTMQFTWTPIPSPTVSPTPVQASSVVKDAFASLKKGAVSRAWNKITSNFGLLSGYIFPVLYVLGGLIAWIFIPRLILRFPERRGNLEAARFRSWPKLSGPIALIGFLFVSLKNRPKRSRHKCPFCNYSLDDIESYGDMNFVACPNCHQTITPVYDLEDYIEYLVEAVKRELEMSKMGAVNLKALIEKDAMTKLVRALITLAVRRRASDLHVEPESEGVKIRARIDGMLQELTTMPKVMASPLVSALKVMGNLDIAERRVPQDGRFQIWVDKADIDIRIASAPSAQGEKCTLRLLDSRSITVDASRLGMEPEERSLFEKTIRKPHGMLLVTGPTGSGKSTTLYVALQQINTGEKNIISIEDPVEFKIKGVNQMQVNAAANFTFATGLRSVLRQDPDVIMIGEVRDRETADIAIEAAMTGHLVLSTLHTIDSASAIGRLVDLDVEPRRFADALQLIIAQRLLRINCTECAKPYKPKQSEWDAVGVAEEELSEGDWKTLRGMGCDVCRFTGFFGRIGLFEFLMPDDEIRDLIENKANTGKIRQAAKNKGMRTLREQGLDRAKEGLTTLEEVIRVTA